MDGGSGIENLTVGDESHQLSFYGGEKAVMTLDTKER